MTNWQQIAEELLAARVHFFEAVSRIKEVDYEEVGHNFDVERLHFGLIGFQQWAAEKAGVVNTEARE